MRKQDQQIVLRVASSLRRELEQAAARDDRPLAVYVRRVLAQHVAARGEREARACAA